MFVGRDIHRGSLLLLVPLLPSNDRHHRRVVLARPWPGRGASGTPATPVGQGRARASRLVHGVVSAQTNLHDDPNLLFTDAIHHGRKACNLKPVEIAAEVVTATPRQLDKVWAFGERNDKIPQLRQLAM